MKKIIFGIFAHPDDEAFGPVGTLLKETKHGTELHLITLTTGQAGTNPDNVPDLGAVRLEEWKKAGTLLGVASQHELGFSDGELGNIQLLEAIEKIEQVIDEIVSSSPDESEIEFMTLDLNGYTGHIDHIVAARAASLVFFRRKKTDPRFTRIRFACLSAHHYPETNLDWLYMEAGRSEHEINETIDAREYHDDLLGIMRVHHSQRSDGEAQIERLGDELGLNYFIVKD